MRAQHSPSGRAVPIRAIRSFGDGTDMGSLWPGTAVRLLDSGKAALALAIRNVVDSLPAGGGNRVALPAYGCPSLVAAALWAGAHPFFYDVAADFSPEPGELVNCLGDQDTVVIHVDAFGMDRGVPGHPRLIRDLAQSFAPYQRGWRPSAVQTTISTSRAKPLSLNGGGALLMRADAIDVSSVSEATIAKSGLALHAALYGLSMRPTVLGALSAIPQISTGKTEFSPITTVQRMPEQWSGTFAAAVRLARERFDVYRDETNSMLALAHDAGVCIPGRPSPLTNPLPLWRIPVLCQSPESAARLASEGRHLGVSRLYGRALPVIMGETVEAAAERWPGAVWIAERLITLPTHGRLSQRQRSELGGLLRKSMK